jgi:acetoin utilization deacetylase AcuC-like enzyme
MKLYTSDRFTLPLPEGHTFPAVKYRRLRERVEAEGVVGPDDLIEAPPASEAELLRVHDAEYVRKVLEGDLSAQEVRVIGLPWSPQLVERSRRSVGGTIAASRAALRDGIAVNLAGGTHHAFADHGAGYCVFNDAAVAARALQAERLVNRVLLIDLDVHQGDGSAAIFADDASVFTLSVHGAKNYPLRKQRSDLDVELPDGTRDDAYLEAVRAGIDEALATFPADLAIYLAGADPFEGDRLGRMAVSREGLAARDRLVFDRCRARHLPVAVTMAGGYARDIDDTVAIQLQTVREAALQFHRDDPP